MTVPISITVLPQLWRVKHDVERGPLWRSGVPEVYRLDPEHATAITKEWQLLIRDLNPTMTLRKLRVLLNHERAFTNKDAGYDFPGGTVKQDWFNLWDLGSVYVPRFDQPRICGGALITGTVDGAWFWIDRLDANQQAPRAADVPLWKKFVALNVANGSQITRFPQGDGADVWIPLVSRKPIRIPLADLVKLDMSKPLPSPYDPSP